MSGLDHPTTVPRENSIDIEGKPNPIDFESVVDSAIEFEDDTDEGSHTEFDPKVFHPSSIGYDEWLILVKKLGLEDMSDLQGIFHTGTMIHEFVQRELYRRNKGIAIEEQVEFEEDGLVFVGHADVYDATADIVYDIKSKGGWYNHDPPVDRHLDQLHAYMRGLDARYGQVIYVSKKDLEVRPWPEHTPFEFDEERWDDVTERCANVRDALYTEGIPQSEAEIPFKKPDNFFANNADLDFSPVNGE